jgi:hypothetical protein
MPTARLSTTHHNKIDLCECFIVARLLDIKDGNDVFVVEIAKKLHLSKRPQAEHGMIKWRDLFDRDFLARWLMQGGT